MGERARDHIFVASWQKRNGTDVITSCPIPANVRGPQSVRVDLDTKVLVERAKEGVLKDYNLHGLVVNSVRHDPKQLPAEALKPAKGNLVFSSPTRNERDRSEVISHEVIPLAALSEEETEEIRSLWKRKYPGYALMQKTAK